MPNATIKTATQYLEIENVSDVVVTDPVLDPITGLWTRDLRIMGLLDGNPTTPAIVVQLRLRSILKEPLKIGAPGFDF